MGNTCSAGSSGKNVVVTGKRDIGEFQLSHGANSKANVPTTPSYDVVSSPKRIIPSISSTSAPRSSRVSGVRTSSIAPVVHNSLPSVPSGSGISLTLSLFSVILTNCDAWDIPSSISTSRFYISLWLGYKVFRFTFEILGHWQTETEFREDVNTNVNSKEYIWTVHGKDYDLNEFVNRHPGGKEAILLGRGRDCTALFESYHPFTNRHRDVLKKYEAVEPSKMSSTQNVEEDKFYAVLKERSQQNTRREWY